MDIRIAIDLLRGSYEFNGYVRIKMDHRLSGNRTGWELRLIADNPTAANLLREALHTIEVGPGAAYRKRAKWVVPIYGIKQVRKFLRTVRPRIKRGIRRPPANADMRMKATDHYGRSRAERRGAELRQRAGLFRSHEL